MRDKQELNVDQILQHCSSAKVLISQRTSNREYVPSTLPSCLRHLDFQWPRHGLTFRSTYHFWILGKSFVPTKFADDLSDFMKLVQTYFGIKLFDMKQIMRSHRVHGGLERVWTNKDNKYMASDTSNKFIIPDQ